MIRRHHVLCVLLGAALLAGTAAGQVEPISESFQEGSLPEGFTVASDEADRAINFTSEGAVFDPENDGDPGRNYIRTVRSDYHLNSFQAFLTVSAEQGTSFGNSAQVFFGLGAGEIGDFGQPDIGTDNTAAFLEFNNPEDPLPDAWQPFRVEDGDADGQGETPYPAGVLDPGPHRLMLDYNAGAQTVRFGVDFNYDGTFDADQISDVIPVDGLVDNWQAGDPSRIFFGGDQSATAWDFVVIPEPATMALLGLGGLALLRRRRR